jgi:hypothetical protein
LLAEHLSGFGIEQDPLENRRIFAGRYDGMVTLASRRRQ